MIFFFGEKEFLPPVGKADDLPPAPMAQEPLDPPSIELSIAFSITNRLASSSSSRSERLIHVEQVLRIISKRRLERIDTIQGRKLLKRTETK
jgi:hypothetical protein